uniref:Uncharacterized protein n=1 Tax=Anopheles arabiensis TaxID=7173 RepID=A0A182IHN8_ANOAR
MFCYMIYGYFITKAPDNRSKQMDRAYRVAV